jgi:pimeloyl-ACP methyl ester carboxylesterase
MKIVLAAALGAFLTLPASARAQASPQPLGRFEPGPCPVETAPGEKIDCGVLVVPENRAKPGSRMIRLPVVIQRSRSATRAKDPVLFMPGGPGVTSMTNARSGKGNPFLETRDHILLEPRGGHAAQPALECPEVAAAREAPASKPALVTQAAVTCRAKLVAAGVDLDVYTSAETADDIEAARVALGYDKLNLYSLSYGSRLALTVLRRHPGSVRSLVLDSPLPPHVNYDEAATANLRRALNMVLDGCAIDPACSRAYPDLPARFTALVAGADRKPLTIDSQAVRGAQLVEALTGALGDQKTTPLLPRIIAEAAAGRTAELAPLVARAKTSSGFAWGLRLSVWCAEEMPFEDPARVTDQVSARHGLGGVDARTVAPEVCRAWKVAPAPAVENTPVKSDVPVLIFAGELDPSTPPQWGQSLLADLPNAQFILMPGRAHGASFNGCAGRMTVAFINDPAKPLDTRCVAQQRGPDWSLSAAKP